MMPTPREIRLRTEFERMKALWTPHSLFYFQCADLDEDEAKEWLHADFKLDVAGKGLPGFLDPEEFERRHPGAGPEKYLIYYKCWGLLGLDDKEEPVPTRIHVMEIVFDWDYPSIPPKFIWWTPIWHPNFDPPGICIQGHPFSIGLTLDTIVLEVGRMVQYQSYNVKSALNHAAANWAKKNLSKLPVDDRDVLDGRRRITERQKPLVELIDPEHDTGEQSGQLVEIVADKNMQRSRTEQTE